MVYSCFFLFVFYGCLNKTCLGFLFFLFLRILFFILTLSFLVSILKIPFHENVLLLEFLVLLFVCPYVYEALSSYSEYSMEFRYSLNS